MKERTKYLYTNKKRIEDSHDFFEKKTWGGEDWNPGE